MSIRLMSRVPLTEIRRLALDASSRTGANLARVLLARVYGLRPEVVTLPPDPQCMLDTADAALMIGDPAMRAAVARQSGGLPQVCEDVDLGALWKVHTGLPFVYAAWAVRRGPRNADLAALMREATAWGAGRLLQIAEAEAPGTGLPVEVCRSYLTQNVFYELGARQLEGLGMFQRMCIEEGLVPAGSPVDVVG